MDYFFKTQLIFEVIHIFYYDFQLDEDMSGGMMIILN